MDWGIVGVGWIVSGWFSSTRITSVVLALMLGASACAVSVSVPAQVPVPIPAQVPIQAPLSFAFGLERDKKGLNNLVAKVSDPRSPRYRKFVSVRKIASRYGAKPASARKALSTLRAAGFEGELDPTGGMIVGSFSTQEAEAFFGVAFERRVNINGSQIIDPKLSVRIPEAISELVPIPEAIPKEVPIPEAISKQVSIPKAISKQVSEVFGGTGTLTNVLAPDERAGSGVIHDPELPDCPEGEKPIPPDGIPKRYGVQTLRDAGYTGSGVRVGLLSIDLHSQAALDAFSSCFGVQIPPVEVIAVNAEPKQLKQTNIESSLDIATLSKVAPGLEGVDVFAFDSNSSIIFPLVTVMERQLKDSTALDLLSSSVSFCSDDFTADELSMSEWLLTSAAATGLGVVASAGDRGSSGCYPATKKLRSRYPAESQYVTAVGGTSIQLDKDLPNQEVVWKEELSKVRAGGGGPSTNFDRPKFQNDTGVAESGRQIPDVALLADPSELGPVVVCSSKVPCEYQEVGGTSVGAPTMAGSLALVLQKFRQTGKHTARLGPLNPTFYYLAGRPAGKAVFNDVTQGNNDVTQGDIEITQGKFDILGRKCCTAGRGYDMASGWGSVRFDKLATHLAKLSNR